MKRSVRIIILAVCALGIAAFCAPAPGFAHGDEIETGSGEKGPVKLTVEQATAIGLKTAKAGPRSISSVLNLNAEIQLPPNRQADVTTIISGSIGEFYANLDDKVKAGQRLVLIKNRTPASQDILLTAPIDGIVDARDIILGQPVEPSTTLFHISDRSKMNAIGKVYEEDLSKVKIGQEAHVRLLGYPADVFTGKVSLIEPNLDPASRTVKAWIELENPNDILKPGMFGRISVILKKNDAALAVPNSSIIEANGEKFVFVKNGDSFARVEIKIGASDEEFAEVTDGLVPGDEVATQGNREIYTMWLTGGKMEAEE